MAGFACNKWPRLYYQPACSQGKIRSWVFFLCRPLQPRQNGRQGPGTCLPLPQAAPGHIVEQQLTKTGYAFSPSFWMAQKRFTYLAKLSG